MDGCTFAARGVICRTISCPSSSTCGLKRVCVARDVGDVLNARVVVGIFARVLLSVAPLHCPLLRLPEWEAMERMLVVLVVFETVRCARRAGAPMARRGDGRKRSRIGSPYHETAWRRMLSWMKRLAVAGALTQRGCGMAG